MNPLLEACELTRLFPRSPPLIDRRRRAMPQNADGQPEKTLYNSRAVENPGETMRYIRPLSIEDAVGQLAGSTGTAVILAGGSDLLVRMKGGFVEPDLIVDIKAHRRPERNP